MTDLTNEVRALDAMVAQGKILESLPAFFAEDCTFTEVAGASSRTSRAAQHEHLSRFFSTLREFKGATLHGQAADGDTTFSEWTFDMVGGDGSRIVWKEVLVRRWRGGRVVDEKYYNATA